ncbi:MAG: hypothetical protein HIU84_14665 [Acidobacteria bacterium]|nr:hypothetical protein [Acidobacteriota bacterium]
MHHAARSTQHAAPASEAVAGARGIESPWHRGSVTETSRVGTLGMLTPSGEVSLVASQGSIRSSNSVPWSPMGDDGWDNLNNDVLDQGDHQRRQWRGHPDP